MAYAQVNYQQKVGNSNLTISEIGCFDTADCNLLLAIGQSIDPESLNVFYTDKGVYTYDLTDKANDDLTWGSITKYNPNVVVEQVGTAGWPQSNFAIVKFVYKSHTGAMVTHFCKVADWTKQLIVDSYDGVTKAPGVYGQPVAWATYKNNTPAPASQDEVVPAPAPVPATAPTPPVAQTLFLPAAAGQWHVYNLAGPYTVAHATHVLAPGKFPPGLTYQILATLAPHVYKIPTQMFGEVAIYAGPDTIAQFPGGHGEGELMVSYSRFEASMSLQTIKEAELFNFDTNAILQGIPAAAPFVAVGKAETNGEVYYMTADCFGEADTTGVATIPAGVSVSDLEAKSTQAAAENVSEKVPVNVIPKDPNKWKKTYIPFLSPVKYIANTDLEVKDLNGLQPIMKLTKDQPIMIAGKFTGPDDVQYYRSEVSVQKDTWYGEPLLSLRREDLGDELDEFKEEALDEVNRVMHHDSKIAIGGTIDGFFSQLLHRRKT